MCATGSRRYIIRDSTMNTELYISSHRTDESHWDLNNSSIDADRSKRDLGQLTLPLPENYTILDTSIFGDSIFNEVLFYLLVINMACFTVVMIQAGKNSIYVWTQGNNRPHMY